MVDYLVLLELPFSVQLENEYEKVKTVLMKELQNVTQDQDSCQNDSELRLGALGQRQGSGSQPLSQSAPAQTGASWAQAPTLWYLQQVLRRIQAHSQLGQAWG